MILNWVAAIAAGLRDLHAQKLIHRDIKPENIFFDTAGLIKIGDFGVVANLKGMAHDAKTLTGTTEYMAPEIGQRVYDEKVDIWALGIIFFTLLTFSIPAAQVVPSEVPTLIASVPPEFSSETKRLLRSMLQKNPSNRPSAAEVCERAQTLMVPPSSKCTIQ